MSWVKSKGIETQFELAGEFELSEFELPGFCIYVNKLNENVKIFTLFYFYLFICLFIYLFIYLFL